MGCEALIHPYFFILVSLALSFLFFVCYVRMDPFTWDLYNADTTRTHPRLHSDNLVYAVIIHPTLGTRSDAV